jgi:chromosome segregation ATPase
MQSPADLNQAIQAMQREMQKALEDIKQKEAQMKELEGKENATNQEIKKDDGSIRQKQQEILHLQQDMDTRKREMAAEDKNLAQLKHEIERLKLEQIQKTNAINNLVRQQKDALSQVNKH